MPGRATAVASGKDLERQVIELGQALGLNTRSQVKVGKRVWGRVRFIDVVLTDPVSRKSIGLECKYQGTPGTAEEKIPATIQDIKAWPIPGLVVFAGEGFSTDIIAYLLSTGLAVDLDDLETWLRLFFGLDF